MTRLREAALRRVHGLAPHGTQEFDLDLPCHCDLAGPQGDRPPHDLVQNARDDASVHRLLVSLKGPGHGELGLHRAAGVAQLELQAEGVLRPAEEAVAVGGEQVLPLQGLHLRAADVNRCLMEAETPAKSKLPMNRS